jgi:hypothetical protein
VTGLLAIIAGLLITAGFLGIVHGTRRNTSATGMRRRSIAELWTKITRRPAGRVGQRRDMILLGSVIIGGILALLTGWLILVVVLPILALGLPYLLILPRPRDIELLEALDRWIRSLAAALATGKSITDDPDLPTYGSTAHSRRDQPARRQAEQPLGDSRRIDAVRRRH